MNVFKHNSLLTSKMIFSCTGDNHSDYCTRTLYYQMKDLFVVIKFEHNKPRKVGSYHN